MARVHGPNDDVHSECRALDGDGDCNCAELIPADVDRAIEVATRQESRANPARFAGATPDADEPGEVDSGGNREPMLTEGVERGFWKESERLRCNAGLDFAAGTLNMDRFKSGNWQRAQELHR